MVFVCATPGPVHSSVAVILEPPPATNPNSAPVSLGNTVGSGTLQSGLGSGGYNTAAVATTIEFTGPGSPVTQTITTS